MLSEALFTSLAHRPGDRFRRYQKGNRMVYTGIMASILIKDISPALHERLREAAERDHRSMNKEVIALLEAALGGPPADLPAPLRAAFPLSSDWLERAIADGRE
jgi:plasmid stability protein